MKYVVFVDDNFHYMDEDERYELGEFPDRDAAIAACKRIVDEFLATTDKSKTAEEMFAAYAGFGEYPWIQTDDPDCKFSAWEYAKARCAEIARANGSSSG